MTACAESACRTPSRIAPQFGTWRIALLLALTLPGTARGEPPQPVLSTVFPPGAQAGTHVEVALEGASLDGLSNLRASDPRIVSRALAGNHFDLQIPATAGLGLCDLRAVGTHGISSPRSILLGRLVERLEIEPNDTIEVSSSAELNTAINGRIEKPGDVDCFRFQAAEGARVVLECWSERIDSPLRAVLELYDSQGQLVASSRGFHGLDPLVAVHIPIGGEHIVKVFDLTYAGSSSHVYRLDIDTGPRPLVAHPCVVKRGTPTKVSIFGWNLPQPSLGAEAASTATASTPAASTPGATKDVASGVDLIGATAASSSTAGAGLPLDRIEIEITPPPAGDASRLRVPLRPAQMAADLFAWDFPGGHFPLAISATDVDVVLDGEANHGQSSALALHVPCEVAGQLSQAEEQDWFVVEARRGEVLWLEAFGERIGAPVDLDLVVIDGASQRELFHESDTITDLGGYAFPMSHLDPSGRFVAPADGRYWILIRNLSAGVDADYRRVYRLSVRREEADFHVAAVRLRSDVPRSLNVPQGGRSMLDLVAIRSRGLTGPIRVTARNLPPGIECPDVWLGPEVDHAPLIVTAAAGAPAFAGALDLLAIAEAGRLELARGVSAGTLLLPGLNMPSGRLAAEVPLGISGPAPALLSAAASRPVVEQGGALDVAVDVRWHGNASQAPLELTGECLSDAIENPLALIPVGETRGWISFIIPPTMPPGPYTIGIRAAARLPGTGANDETMTLLANPVSFEVQPARVLLAVDPHAPRKIARGQTIQLTYTAQRVNGFIGKIHTDLVAPGGVQGLRARGVTFVGQTDSGVLQIIATENAPLGRQPFLRLEGVATVEDQPLFRGSCPVELEIVE